MRKITGYAPYLAMGTVFGAVTTLVDAQLGITAVCVAILFMAFFFESRHGT
jgi:hypothetical protein